MVSSSSEGHVYRDPTAEAPFITANFSTIVYGPEDLLTAGTRDVYLTFWIYPVEDTESSAKLFAKGEGGVLAKHEELSTVAVGAPFEFVRDLHFDEATRVRLVEGGDWAGYNEFYVQGCLSLYNESKQEEEFDCSSTTVSLTRFEIWQPEDAFTQSARIVDRGAASREHEWTRGHRPSAGACWRRAQLLLSRCSVICSRSSSCTIRGPDRLPGCQRLASPIPTSAKTSRF